MAAPAPQSSASSAEARSSMTASPPRSCATLTLAAVLALGRPELDAELSDTAVPPGYPEAGRCRHRHGEPRLMRATCPQPTTGAIGSPSA